MKTLAITIFLLLPCTVSSCITKRTISEGGNVQSEQYVIKRPVKNLLENSN